MSCVWQWLHNEFVITHSTVHLKQVHCIACKLYLNRGGPPKVEADLLRIIRKAEFEEWLNTANVRGILYLQTIANSFGEGKEAKG